MPYLCGLWRFANAYWNIIKEEFGDRMSELMQLSGSVIKEFNEKRKGLQQDSDMEQLVYSPVLCML